MFIAIIHVPSPGNTSMFSMICEIFSYVLYPIYGLLALKRRPIDFEDTCRFGIVIGKLILNDVWAMPALGKIIVFISLGDILLILSFLYQKLKDALFNEEEQEQE